MNIKFKKNIPSKSILFILFFIQLFLCPAFTQEKQISNWDWNQVENKPEVNKQELKWLLDSLNKNDRENILQLVLSLSHPAVSQLLPYQFYLDGSFRRNKIKPYIDSLSIRPPNNEAGIVHICYLTSKIRKELLGLQSINTHYIQEFTGNPLNLQPIKVLPNKIKLSFEYTPAQTILEILGTPNISYENILQKINTKEFNALYKHHSQSFYTAPLNKERMALCLERAASTQPLDVLYKYINPFGLLNFTDVQGNIKQYEKLIIDLKANEQLIFDHIKSKILPYLPDTTMFTRNVSLFLISDSDGWGSSGITAIDINYYKDRYDLLLPLLMHETYHSGQEAVAIKEPDYKVESEKQLVDILNYLFLEGTATYAAPPAVKTDEEYQKAVSKGVELMEKIYQNISTSYKGIEVQQLADKGIAGGGPFYWLGAELAKTIENVFGKKHLASIIPYGGLYFMNTYFKATEKSKKVKNLFSNEFKKYIRTLK